MAHQKTCGATDTGSQRPRDFSKPETHDDPARLGDVGSR